MQVEGGCHCGTIRYALTWPGDWPGDGGTIGVRACSCTFCQMHGGVYTSHRDAALTARLRNPRRVSRYRFGTGTADFYICSRCGAVPFVVSEIDGRLLAVVNINTLRDVERSAFERAAADFDGETVESRLERREQTWIRDVRIEEGAD